VLYAVRRPCFAPPGIDVTLGICFTFFCRDPMFLPPKRGLGMRP
jgi:hypothetical protein